MKQFHKQQKLYLKLSVELSPTWMWNFKEPTATYNTTHNAKIKYQLRCEINKKV